MNNTCRIALYYTLTIGDPFQHPFSATNVIIEPINTNSSHLNFIIMLLPHTPPSIHRSRPFLLFEILLVIIMSRFITNANAAADQQHDSPSKNNIPLHISSKETADTTWSYYEGGTGKTVLLVHGFSSNKELWFAVGQKLSKRFHVIIPDLPGWGASTRMPGANYNIDHQAARLHEFLVALNLKDVTLVGHSMGGAITGVYAAQYPERLKGLVLISPLGLNIKDNDFMRLLKEGINPFIYSDRAGIERMAKLVYLTPPEFSDQQIEHLLITNKLNHHFIESTLDELRVPSQWLALEPRIKELALPVLGIGCRMDRIIDVLALKRLEQELINSTHKKTVVLEDCNHLPMIEKSADTVRLLNEFSNNPTGA